MHNQINPRSLRIRAIFAVLLMFAVLVLLLFLFSAAIIQRSFAAIETDTVEDRVEQAINALDNAISNINRVAIDYATWDDTYTFVLDRNQAYIDANFGDFTFQTNSLSYLAVVNPLGDVVFARAYDRATSSEIPTPTDMQRIQGVNARLLQHTTTATPQAGLIMFETGPMLIAAQPILTSLGEGPPRGTLLMGRALDAVEVARLAEITRLDLQVLRGDDPTLSPELAAAIAALGTGTPIAAIPVNDQIISGVTHIRDLRGQPGVILQVDMPRDVLQLAQQTARQYTLVLFSAGIVVALLAAWLLERTVLRRLLNLHTQVNAIDAAHPQAQISIPGRDEIGQLGSAINAMVARLAQTQAQLRTSEQRYRQLIELSPDAMIIHDGIRIRYVNPAGAALLGADLPAMMIGQPIVPSLQPLQPASDGSPVHLDQQFVPPVGEPIEAELVVLPFTEADAPAVQVIIRNITARKQIEQALHAAKEAADTANRAKSLFLATMSHELRTPLTAIIGYAELLDQELHDHADPLVLRDLGRIKAAGTHLLALINDVLDLSKIETGQMQVRPSPLFVSGILDTVADSVRPLASRNANQLIFAPSLPDLELETDPTHLCQILINLVGNACKFTHAGQVTVTVEAVPDAPEQIRFVVTDTGIGMRPEQVALLFQDFVQVDSSSTRKYGGTGLGLSLSQRLANLLGGSISVTSTEGVGSTFTLTLPQIFAGQRTTPPPTRPTSTAPSPHTLLAADAPTRLVLVIDDDPAVRDLLPRALAQPNIHFEVAATGDEGLELATVLLPDLIILDLLLPGLDGWSVLRLLREQPETRTIPVIILTIDETAEQGIVFGAASILHKPIDREQLRRETSQLLQQPTHGGRVLIIEDHPEIGDYLQRTLTADGWETRLAADGHTALQMLTDHPVDLAIVDLMLPDYDGIQLIAQLRQRPDAHALPILVVTAKDLSADEVQQLHQSAAYVLQKGSFRSDDLIHTARTLLNRLAAPSQE
jgi:PAS domain S-box-containing protein